MDIFLNILMCFIGYFLTLFIVSCLFEELEVFNNYIKPRYWLSVVSKLLWPVSLVVIIVIYALKLTFER